MVIINIIIRKDAGGNFIRQTQVLVSKITQRLPFPATAFSNVHTHTQTACGPCREKTSAYYNLGLGKASIDPQELLTYQWMLRLTLVFCVPTYSIAVTIHDLSA